MRRSCGLLVAVFLALALPAAAVKVCVVVTTSQARGAAARAGKDVSVLAFDRARLADPLEKGRFLAALQASDRVIAVADGQACGWLGREVDGVAVSCVMPYDAAQILDFARSVGWSRIAAVHMTGYEKVYARLRILARARDIELDSVRLVGTRDLTRALPRALETAKAVWILGDTRLTEGAAFDHLIEATLPRRIPLIVPDSGLVARGAFLGSEVDRSALTRHAVDAANLAAAGAPTVAALTTAPGARLVINRILARRWGVRVPGEAR
ncbi:MAG: hypothetical protein Q8T11_03515 [Elusimicrobiota bacterium]|nr:hypothetical protein [Elusimicrobiota bacterium]